MPKKTLIFINLFLYNTIFGQSGKLTGIVIDAATHQPLIGVNIFVEGTNLGCASDADGNIRIENIPVGSYNIHVSMMGYEQIKRANVHIVTGKNTQVNFELHSQVLQSEDVEVTATFFEKSKDAITSSRTVDIEEIRSDPVGAYDIMAMMQALPSVVSGSDQSNEIIVRGGAPGENLFIMDFLEIPYPNHYPEQGKGGGPVTMVDTEFIEKIDFYAGAFPARYGEKLSSVLDVNLREGRSENHEIQTDLNMAGFGLTMEGPLNNESTYLYSLKRSFLDFVISSTGIQAIPKYWSSQGKIAYHLSPTQKLYLNFIGGIDEINIEGENNPQLRGAENVDYTSKQSTIGLTYKNLFSRKGYFITSLGQSWVMLNTKVYEIDDQLKQEDYHFRDDVEKETAVRSELVYQFSKQLELNAGITAKNIILDYDNWFKVRPIEIFGYSLDSSAIPQPVSEAEFYATYFENPNTIAVPIDTIGTLDTIKTFSVLKYTKFGEFFNLNYHPNQTLELFFGGRYDYISFTAEGSFSPRLGMKFHLSPVFSFNTSAGRYYQPPFNIYLNSVRGTPENLKNYYADQIVAGLEYFPDADARITLEYFTKKYDDMITFEMLTGSDDRDSLNYYNAINGGKGRSKGIEFFIQKKYSHNWYGSFSWSHTISEGVDPRDGSYYPWDYDYRDVVNIIGGYKIRYTDYNWYKEYKESMWAKALSWLPFMPSDEYEISMKFRYMGGRPFTPKQYDHTIRSWFVNSNSSWNTERYEPYLRLDLMFQQRFNFKKMNLVAFWDFINVFNRKNPWEYTYLDDGKKIMSWQYTTMPVGGMILEF